MPKIAARQYSQYPIYLVMMIVGAFGANALSSLVGPLSSKGFGGLSKIVPREFGAMSSHMLIAIFCTFAAIAIFWFGYILVGVSDWRAASPFRLFSKAAKGRAVNGERTGGPSLQVVAGVHDGLDKQLSDLVEIVNRHLVTTAKQSDTFQTVQATLSPDSNIEQIRSIVETLVSISAEGQTEAEALRAELKDAQTQALTLRRKLVKVEKLATLDPLTSLPNRRHFDEFIETAVAEAHEDYTPLSVVMIDIDHFKKVNDTFGHPAGDAVIKQLASVISKNVRSSDLVARYGGEEFVLVLKMTASGSALQVAERIRASILDTVWVDPKSNTNLGKVTASFGIAEIADNEKPESLVARADKQLYAAKKLGRNRVGMNVVH